MLRLLLLFFILGFTYLPVSGQVAIDNINSEVTLEGENGFHLHEIKQGQTLYSISKAYGVTMKQITAANPRARISITTGQILKIPATAEKTVKAKNAAPSSSPRPPKPVEEKMAEIPAPTETTSTAGDNRIHKVQPGETLYSLSRQYNASIDEVYALNPDVIRGLQAGQTLYFPPLKGEAKAKPEVKAKPEPKPVPKPKAEAVEKPIPTPSVSETKKEMAKPVEAIKVVELVAIKGPEKPPVEVVEKVIETPAVPKVEEKREPTPAETIKDEKIQVPEKTEEPDPASKDNLIAEPETMDEPVVEEKKTAVPAEKTEMVRVENADYSLSLENPAPLEQFLSGKFKHFFADTSNPDSIVLREFFYFEVGQDGKVKSLKDERTETNENSRFISDSDFPKVKALDFDLETKEASSVHAPLGIVMNAKRTNYKIRVQKDKIRLFRVPFYVEYLPEDHPHFDLIMKRAEEMGEKGMCQLVVVSGEMGLYQHAQKEYNPFGIQEKALFEKDFHVILEIDFL